MHSLRLLILVCFFLASTATWAQQYNFRSYSLEEGLPQSEVRALIQDHQKSIWLGTNGGGLCRFNGKEFEIYTKKQGLPDNLIRAILEDRQHNLWLATSKGITMYDGHKFVNYGEPNGVESGVYFRILQDDQGKIWVLGLEDQGQRKILYFENGQFVDFTAKYPELTEDNQIFFLFQDKQGHLQIITRNGLYVFDGLDLKESFLSDLEPLKDKVIFPFLEDSHGSLWLAAGQMPNINDLYTYKDGILSEVSLPASITPNRINFATEDSQGNIWISFFGTGILKYQPDIAGEAAFQLFTRNNGLPNNFINNILEDHEGNIWLGSNGGGLIKYSSDKFISLNLAAGMSSEIIRAIFQDEKGDLWFGTAGGGVMRYDGTQITNVVKEEDSPLGFIRKFLPLGDDRFLMASVNGLWEYDGKEFKEVNEQYGLPAGAGLGDIIADGTDYWMAVFGKGVAKFDGKTTTFINMASDSIAGNNITHLFKDSKGNYWLASNLVGVTKFQPDPSIDLENRTEDLGHKVTNYNSANGLNNDYVLQIAEDKNGALWLATYGGGLNVFQGDSIFVIDTDDGLTSDNIYSVITDEEGNIWAGTQNGVDKITIDDEGNVESITNYDKYDGFTGIEANGMANFRDREGNLWFGTIKGAMRYSPGADSHNPTPPPVNITDMKLFFKEVDWRDDQYKDYLAQTTSWFSLPEQLTLPYDLNHVSFNYEALSFQVPEKVQYQWRLKGLDKAWSPVSGKTEATYANLPPGDYIFEVKASNNDGVWNPDPASFAFMVKPPWWGTWGFRALAGLLVLGLVYLIYWTRVRAIKEKKKELERLVKEKTGEVVKQKNEILQQSKKLQKSYQSLELLSDIGKDITASLSIEKIVGTVYENVNALLKADVFWIGVANEKKGRIDFRGAVENGKKLPMFSFDQEEKDRLAVWCWSNQEEVFINDYEKEYRKYISVKPPTPIGKPSQSIIYLPLVTKGITTGVISVQSYEKDAFSDYHLSLLRNMAIHTKIALENAAAFEKIGRQSRKIKKRKSQIEEKNGELLELNNEKNHLIEIVAHDLRNPLTSAMTFGGMLKSEGDNLTEEQKEYVHHMVNAMQRMSEMANRILDIKAIESKKLDLRLEKVDLVVVLQEVKDDFKEAAQRKQLQLHLQVESADTHARVDRNYLTQVYENLISNAIKFSPPNNQIKVKLSGDNGKVLTEVIDQGPGLTAKDHKLLFRRYQKLSAKPTGGESSTGLGLSIVKKYVEAMAGKVWCESEPGKGARFVVELRR